MSLRFPLLSGILLSLAACANTPEILPPQGTGIVVEGAVIRNDLHYDVTDVMIESKKTGAFVGCGYLLRRSRCSTSFEAAEYMGGNVQITWKERGEPRETAPFEIRIPEGMPPGSLARVEVIIFAPGQAGAKLVHLRD